MTDTDQTADRVAEIRARLDAATEGPWKAQDYDDHPGEEGCVILAGVGLRSHAIAASITYPWHDEANTVADAELIANAPADLSWLLSELEAAQAESEEHRKGMNRNAFLWSETYQKLKAANGRIGDLEAELEAAQARLDKVRSVVFDQSSGVDLTQALIDALSEGGSPNA